MKRTQLRVALPWSPDWRLKWILLGVYLAVVNTPAVIVFLALEREGLFCEWNKIFGCSTLSSYMVANWGVVFMITATLVIGETVLAIACWHWVTVHVLQEG